jgi:hypothetical protein
MGFLRDVLGRPGHEQAFLLVVTGVPGNDATVPSLTKKPLADIASFITAHEETSNSTPG